MGKIEITLKKSIIGFPSGQRKTVASLGLKRVHSKVQHEDTPSIMGMVSKIRHLIEVKNIISDRESGGE